MASRSGRRGANAACAPRSAVPSGSRQRPSSSTSPGGRSVAGLGSAGRGQRGGERAQLRDPARRRRARRSTSGAAPSSRLPLGPTGALDLDRGGAAVYGVTTRSSAPSQTRSVTPVAPIGRDEDGLDHGRARDVALHALAVARHTHGVDAARRPRRAVRQDGQAGRAMGAPARDCAVTGVAYGRTPVSAIGKSVPLLGDAARRLVDSTPWPSPVRPRP